MKFKTSDKLIKGRQILVLAGLTYSTVRQDLWDADLYQKSWITGNISVERSESKHIIPSLLVQHGWKHIPYEGEES